MTKTLLVSLTIIASLSFGASPPMKVKDLPEWHLAPYNMRTHSIFEPLFTDLAWAPMRPYAFVIENKTAKSIVGLAIDWKLDDSSPSGRNVHAVIDGEERPILGGHRKMVIVPGAAKTEDNVQKSTVGGQPLTDWVDRFLLAPDPSVEIDVVILDDGEVAGPDRGHLVDSWIARDRARQIIQDRLRSSKDIRASFGKLKDESKPVRGRSLEEAMTADWIQRLVPSPNLPDQFLSVALKKLERKPLPRFYRNQ